MAQISSIFACFSLVSLFASARRRRAPVYSKWPPGASVFDYRMKMYIGTLLMDIWFQNDIPPNIGPFGCYCTECAQIPWSQEFPKFAEISTISQIFLDNNIRNKIPNIFHIRYNSLFPPYKQYMTFSRVFGRPSWEVLLKKIPICR